MGALIPRLRRGITYRLLCATRNLTNDRSWDAVISLDGRAGKHLEADSEPLSRFVDALPGLCTHTLSTDRITRVGNLAKELRRVVWELPDDASAVHFHALGIRRGSAVPDFTGYRRLVVSPFVDPEGLAIVAPTTERGTVLISRPKHVDNLDPIPVDTDIRVLSVLAELDDERASGELSGLHAKMVILERDRRAHLFLGSANATRAAYGGNVEFLVEVIRGARKYGVDAHLATKTGFGALLEEYTPQPPTLDLDEEKRFKLQSLLRTLSELCWTATVRPTLAAFDINISTDRPLPPTEARLKIELMTLRGKPINLTPEHPAEGVFPAVSLADITPFLVLTAEWQDLAESTVVPARLLGDPDDRLDAVLARQVDSPEKFMRFLLLILGYRAREMASMARALAVAPGCHRAPLRSLSCLPEPSQTTLARSMILTESLSDYPELKQDVP